MKGFVAGIIFTLATEGAVAVAAVVYMAKNGGKNEKAIEIAVEIVICVGGIIKILRKKK